MKKVLVVDDERHIVDLVRLYLEKDGFTVLAAYATRRSRCMRAMRLTS